MRVWSISLASYHTKVWALVLAGVASFLAPGFVPSVALAQPHVQPHSELPPAPSPFPGFWDPKRRPERPDLSRLSQIRFMTETDYPPFNYAGADGNPVGFNVELARLICEELKITCTIQMRRFDTLIQALNENRGEAVIASIAVTAETRKVMDFTDPYYRVPARFVTAHKLATPNLIPEQIEGKKVGVVGGSAHEAYLKTLFTEAQPVAYLTADAARDALRRGEIDYVFGDGIALSFWLNGTDSENCCAFAGGPFFESRYFGEGVGIAVRKGNETVRQALNWALYRLWEKGRFADLWLRYFPVNPF
ncbi:transporter substrate-binding domain-containing protein [Pseudorhodoplanes sinuspersici]|uniref:ABC transporter substrate-binding protein n=1 Tax=Pseudorhodoplanes sinuspersici TaxID=1235591 RepID=A0A1W6ZPC0_9HYPH|nr:ABC transporter substrate-binding protein [Pseudorhodoplanes sinuspersici]RKE69791.1 amino acid ABC transporter substrate-binding protein (PAAT family) [Pseudorhodoplanes sinuspersici]